MIGDEKIPDPTPGKTSIRMGPAILKWIDKEHLGLFRHVITVKNDGGQVEKIEHPEPIGPLGIYRRAGMGDEIALRTSDPKTNEPISLALVWRPGMDGGP